MSLYIVTYRKKLSITLIRQQKEDNHFSSFSLPYGKNYVLRFNNNNISLFLKVSLAENQYLTPVLDCECKFVKFVKMQLLKCAAFLVAFKMYF